MKENCLKGKRKSQCHTSTLPPIALAHVSSSPLSSPQLPGSNWNERKIGFLIPVLFCLFN
jgi:hypothetical protein